MKIIDYFKMAFLNLNKRKLRTAINIFAISVGVMLIVTLVSLGTGIQNYFMSTIKELNNLKQITVYSNEYKSQDEIAKALSTTDKNGDIDVNKAVQHKQITNDVIEKLTKDNRISDSIMKYTSEASEISFEDKKAKEIPLANFVGKYYLDNEFNSLKDKSESADKKDIQAPIKYIYAGKELSADDKNSVLLPEAFVRNTLGVEDVNSIIGKDIVIKSIIPDYDKTKTFEKSLKIVGVIDQRFYQPAFIVSKDVMEEIKNFDNGNTATLEDRGVDELDLSVKEVDDVPTLTSMIEQNLHYKTESVKNVATTVDKALLGLKIALSVLGIIVISIASLGVINTMIMSIHERKKVIGLMKAVGASKRDIRNIFLIESGTIGFLGGLVGVFFSYFGLIFLENVLRSVLGYLEITDTSFLVEIVKLDFKTALLTIAFAIVLTMFAGLFPAIRASRLNPVDSLRHD